MNSIVAILTVIALSFAGYSHLMSRTVIPSIDNIIVETETSFFSIFKYDLSEENQMQLYSKILEKNKDEYDRFYEWLITAISPLYGAISYIPDEDKSIEKIDESDFVGFLFFGKGSNLVKYLLTYELSAVTIPRVPNAKLFLTPKNKEYSIGMVENILVFSKSAKKTKSIILKLNNAISPTYKKSRYKFQRELDIIEESSFSGAILDVDLIKKRNKDFFKKIFSIKPPKEHKAWKDIFSLIRKSNFSYAIGSLNKEGDLSINLNIKGRGRNEIRPVASYFYKEIKNTTKKEFNYKIEKVNKGEAVINIEVPDFANLIVN